MRVTLSDPLYGTADDFVEVVADFDAAHLLEVVGNAAAIAYSQPADDAVCNPVALSLVATAAYHVNLGGKATVSDLELRELCRRANGLSAPAGSEPSASAESAQRHLVRVISAQRMFQDHHREDIARTELQLRLSSELKSRGRAECERAFGATALELRTVLFGAHAQMVARREATAQLRRISAGTWSGTADARRLHAVVRNLSHSLADGRALAAKSNDPTRHFGHWRTSFLATPFLALDDARDVFTTPVPVAALRFMTDGFFDQLWKAEPDGKHRGDLAERYVASRICTLLGAERYARLEELAGQPSPDALCDDDCVLEVKGRRMADSVRFTGDLCPITTEQKGIPHAVRQLLSETRRTRCGDGRGLSRSKLDEVVPVIVTPDGLPGFAVPLVRRHLMEQLWASTLVRWPELLSESAVFRRLEWLSYDELEAATLRAAYSGCTLGAVLRGFRGTVDLDTAVDSTDFTLPDLRSWVREGAPELSKGDPILEPVFEETIQEVIKSFRE